MAFCANHDHIYFDKLCRTKKAETVLSLIYATYEAKRNIADVSLQKEAIARNLVQAYNLFKFDAGTYTGTLDQFQSQYTIGHEMGIWKNSDLDLTDKAINVAEGKITIKDYFDIVFLNYIQPVNNIIVHPLYEVINYAKENNLDSLTKEDIKNAFPTINNRAEDINGLYNMLIGTNFFKEINGELIINKDKDEILRCCEKKYINQDYQKVKEELNNLDDYLEYLLKDNRSSELIINERRNVIMEKKKLAINPNNGADNIIYYGAPGCGKSHKAKEEVKKVEEADSTRVLRVTFHPEYTNSDFVGQILPTIEKGENNEEKVKYVFNPGPFTKALEKALTTDEWVYLIIEEINRGNAAAIFGDLFQLLDRQKRLNPDGTENKDYGRSEYEITNINVSKYLSERIELPDDFKIYIPRNLFIRATMNSSDQNVFTLDTAFKRRWDFEQVPNEFNDKEKEKFSKLYIPGTNVSWVDFLNKLNPAILDYKLNHNTAEDKQLGKYFVDEDCLTDHPMDIKDPQCQLLANKFAYKVLEYLWNDVCKIDKDTWFYTNEYKTLEQLIQAFKKPKANQNPLSIFKGISFNGTDETTN